MSGAAWGVIKENEDRFREMWNNMSDEQKERWLEEQAQLNADLRDAFAKAIKKGWNALQVQQFICHNFDFLCFD